MSLKSFVKDDLWRVNYIYPFAKKHLADEKGRIVAALKESDHQEKGKRVAEFENILDGPAQGFEEALQRTMFFNQVMWQTRHRLNGFGHMDWFLDPYYQKDMASGKITEADVDRMLDDFCRKFSQYSYYRADVFVGNIGQIIVLGGLKEDGTYFCSKLTEKIMCAQARARVPDRRRSCG